MTAEPGNDTARLGFTILGPIALTIDGEPQPIGGAKPRALLAKLLINRNQVVSADALADAAWDGNPPLSFRNHLQVSIAKLRKAFQVPGIDPMRVLTTAPPGYKMVVADHECDAGRFDAYKSAGHTLAAAGRFEEASTQFTSALEQWSGPALADLRGHRFADDYATPLEDERLATQIARAEAEIACGRPTLVLSELSSLAGLHPLHEPLWGQWIIALYLSNRPSDALDACRRLRKSLDDELAVDPSPAIQELELKILRQEPLTGRPQAAPVMATTVVNSRPKTPPAQLRDPTGRIIPIGPGTLRVGRAPDNHVVIADDQVSRYHAAIVRSTAGIVIRDLFSSNGVFVGAQQVVESAVLRHGDVIQIGSSAFVFEYLEP
ncbi:FHA domain-containing protein [Antrihabitans sp. YC3-6]|uniref:FHA domain-containing protein n=1 Tax=Antrihabitans stalagmiti TaxID=2799499 RepID=A0A934NVB6_9NOCA|nr:BTAD domain-containing putative transcriptional regulator [Antrihabitans stalagmiti]MBJ8342253.1 FHA domain-containing protein [Antrihabitans stalagmiti]